MLDGLILEVINTTTKVDDLKPGDFIVQYDRVHRVLDVWYERACCWYTVDIAGNGDEYERWEPGTVLNTIRVVFGMEG